MPKNNTHFSTKWLNKLDATKTPSSRWLKHGKTNLTFFCTVCNEEKSCKNGGWSDVFKHSQRIKHLQRFKDVIESAQLINTTLSSSSFVEMTTNSERILTQEEKVTRAETYWALATAKLGFSYNSSQYIQELFRQMFTDSLIAKEFSMKPRKLSYIVSHGTGIYFRQMMLKDLIKAPAYTLLFDETMIVGIRKQLDLHFRFWSDRKQRIVVRYYKSLFFRRTTAEILFRSIVDALRADGIDLTKMLMLGRDNPNVNKLIEKLFDKEIRLEREKRFSSSNQIDKSFSGLIQIGSCPLHLIHNSFRIGLDSIDWPIEEFLNNLVIWFNRSPPRRDDYLKVAKFVSNDVGKFIRRFVITRWLDVGPIFDRVIDQWTNLRHYFLVYLPSKDPKSIQTFRYVQICSMLNDELTLSRLKFFVFLYHHVYEETLTWFQQTEPLIHLLYDQCEQLIRRLFSCFIVDEFLTGKDFEEISRISFQSLEIQKSDSNLDIGESTRRDLSTLTDEETIEFFSNIRRIFVSISEDLFRTLPLQNDFLRHLKCFHPSMRENENSYINVMNVARSFPSEILSNEMIDRISGEWRVYQNESIPIEWIKDENGFHSIDFYWRKILTMKTNIGKDKFVGLAKLIQCVFALSHGNGDVERGFSENSFLLSDDRSLLSDASINGLRSTRDAVKFFADGKPHDVPFSKGLLESVRQAHSKYNFDLEKQKEISTRKKRSNDDEEISNENETILRREKDFFYKNLTNIQQMIDEGSERLAAAISTKNFLEIETAQLLIESGQKKLAATHSQMISYETQLNQLGKKRKI